MVPDVLVRQFLITVTYLMALSLIFTGDCNCSSPVSFPIACSSASTRRSLPNLVGVLLLVTLAAGLLGDIAGDPCSMSRSPPPAGDGQLVVLCNLWLVIIFPSGIRPTNASCW